MAERTIMEIGARQVWPMAAVVGGGGVVLIVVDVFAVPGVSLFTLLGVLCLLGGGSVLVGSRSPSPVLRASTAGFRFFGDRETPWADVRTLVLLSREEMAADGATTTVYAALTPTAAGDVDLATLAVDAVTGWAALPGAVADAPADVLETRLREVRPGLTVVDLRGR
ncbi:MAG TPA: hypothetical protein VGP26_26905 [Actinophytocola sp.]|jgi:hypothetical protein|nr:hypothetical protein [Actinophytocola sp.]